MPQSAVITLFLSIRLLLTSLRYVPQGINPLSRKIRDFVWGWKGVRLMDRFQLINELLRAGLYLGQFYFFILSDLPGIGDEAISKLLQLFQSSLMVVL